MICKHCQATMTQETNSDYCCDNCGATYDSIDKAWTEPTVHPNMRNPVPMKGDKGGECNRAVCKTQDAHWYNRSTLKYYCPNCAKLIMQYPENKGLLEKEE